MGGWNALDWDYDQLRKWVEVDLLTHAEIGRLLGRDPKLVSKAVARAGIRSQRTGPRAQAGHPEWQGGRIVDKDGYIRVHAPHHPTVLAKKPLKGRRLGNQYLCEHRLVMEMMLGRYLLPHEVVHHKNADKRDNSPQNLHLYSANAEHLRDELKGRVPNWSEDGKSRIRDAVNQLADSRRGLTRDEYRQRRKTARSIEQAGTDPRTSS